jgi:hypothetical protein
MRAFVKISGDLLEMPSVIQWLKDLQSSREITVCCGGGTQINEEFTARGYPIRYGPLGRETETDEQRQLAIEVLGRNLSLTYNRLTAAGVKATVIIPVVTIGNVECPVNGDTFVLAAYLGFDECYILTLRSRTATKEKEFSKYPRIKVVGF